jgi:ribonuclease VapC
LTIFADASALIAIIARERDALDLVDCPEHDREHIYSALSAWETVAGLSHTFGLTIEQSHARVRLFLEERDFRPVPIGAREFDLAADAYARFGKGRHPANCYAYACAKANHARLLFKGNDFVKTDTEPAFSG